MKKQILYKVSRKRSLIKALTWRIIASLDTFFIVWIITGRSSWAGSVAGLEILTKTILYYLHERGWNYIIWGKYLNEHNKYFLLNKFFYNFKEKRTK